MKLSETTKFQMEAFFRIEQALLAQGFALSAPDITKDSMGYIISCRVNHLKLFVYDCHLAVMGDEIGEDFEMYGIDPDELIEPFIDCVLGYLKDPEKRTPKSLSFFPLIGRLARFVFRKGRD